MNKKYRMNLENAFDVKIEKNMQMTQFDQSNQFSFSNKDFESVRTPRIFVKPIENIKNKKKLTLINEDLEAVVNPLIKKIKEPR